MTTIKDLTEQDVLALAEGEPDWLRDRRQEAFKAFLDMPWPDSRVEEWRYTDPRRFDLTRPLLRGSGDDPRVGDAEPRSGGIAGALDGRWSGYGQVVDGRLARATVRAQRGVVVTSLATAAHAYPELLRRHLGSVVGADEKYAALNLAAFTGGAFVYVPDEAECEQPIVVTIEALADGASIPRVLVVLGRSAKASIYVDHAGDARQTVVEVVEVVVGEGAVARVVTAQDWGSGVDHIAAHTGLVYRDGHYHHIEVSLGGRTVYIRPDVRLDHPGSNGELLGVYFCDEGQQVEHRSLIHHNASHTTSDLVYKGALQGDSRATFFGNIKIEQHARGTASDQTNRNLILTDKARADSIPFLEIENSDVVRCGHHSSVGQVDEIQMFYLESRGISREEAARLLVFGFFAEITDRIDLPGVTEAILAEVERGILSGPTAMMDQRRVSK
ncbi:MAG: Fe-S cluster assembly protein SufD [Egibacteraceae bacterium]